MLRKITFPLTIAALVAIMVCFFWYVCGNFRSQKRFDQKVLVSKNDGKVKKITEITVKGKNVVKIVTSEQARPNVLGDEAFVAKDGEKAEEETLTEAQRTVLKELQDALDDNNVKRVRKALLKFSKCVSKTGDGRAVFGGAGMYAGLPKSMREAAVEALGWFGAETATDLIDLIADPDEDIGNDAWGKFEQALSDYSMGDAERADLIVKLATVLTDPDRLDSIFMSFSDVRNSYKADAIVKILESGTSQAQSVLKESLELHTESDVTTIDDVKRWKAMNPDDPGDEEFYNPKKDE